MAVGEGDRGDGGLLQEEIRVVTEVWESPFPARQVPEVREIDEVREVPTPAPRL